MDCQNTPGFLCPYPASQEVLISRYWECWSIELQGIAWERRKSRAGWLAGEVGLNCPVGNRVEQRVRFAQLEG
jgi:hypothetical protein